MLPDQFLVNVDEVQKWEKEVRDLAFQCEQEGNLDKAKMYFCVATLLFQLQSNLEGLPDAPKKKEYLN